MKYENIRYLYIDMFNVFCICTLHISISDFTLLCGNQNYLPLMDFKDLPIRIITTMNSKMYRSKLCS